MPRVLRWITAFALGVGTSELYMVGSYVPAVVLTIGLIAFLAEPIAQVFEDEKNYG